MTPAELQRSTKPLLSVAAATRLLGLNPATGRAGVASGDIPSVQIAGRRYVPRTVLLELMGLPDLAVELQATA